MTPNLPETPSEFTYSGWLVFTPFEVNVKSNLNVSSVDLAEEFLEDELPRPARDNLTAGFEIQNTRELVDRTSGGRVPPGLKNLIHLKYIQSEEDQTMLYDPESGDFTENPGFKISESDLYWNFPNYLLVKGKKRGVEGARSRLQSQLVDSMRTKEMQFQSDFFMWLISRHRMSDELPGELSIRGIQRIEAGGEEESSKLQMEGDGDITTISLAHILSEDAEISTLEVSWIHRGETIRAEITSDTIHVYVSESLDDYSDIERMSTSLLFCYELLDLYSDWRSLQPSDRYPSMDFFQEFYDEASEKGLNLSYESDTISRYQRLRKKE